MLEVKPLKTLRVGSQKVITSKFSNVESHGKHAMTLIVLNISQALIQKGKNGPAFDASELAPILWTTQPGSCGCGSTSDNLLTVFVLPQCVGFGGL